MATLRDAFVALALIEDFLGWWPLWRLARCATWAHTLQARRRLLDELAVYDVQPLPTPTLTGVRLLGHYLQLLWLAAAMPLLAFDQTTDALPPVEQRRVRVEHFRSSTPWDRRHVRWVAVMSLAEATELWFESTFGGAVEVLLAIGPAPTTWRAWQTLEPERFNDGTDGTVIEVQRTALQVAKSGFIFELLEEAVMFREAESDDENLPWHGPP